MVLTAGSGEFVGDVRRRLDVAAPPGNLGLELVNPVIPGPTRVLGALGESRKSILHLLIKVRVVVWARDRGEGG